MFFGSVGMTSHPMVCVTAAIADRGLCLRPEKSQSRPTVCVDRRRSGPWTLPESRKISKPEYSQFRVFPFSGRCPKDRRGPMHALLGGFCITRDSFDKFTPCFLKHPILFGWENILCYKGCQWSAISHVTL